jgi:predicted amino acid dehydrogenase
MTGTETETPAVLETDAYVVVGTCGDEIQYWAAAVPRSRAAHKVRQVLGSEWKTKVMAWRLAPERLEQLKLKPNSVRQIG